MADAVATFAVTLEDALSPSAARAKASIAALSSELGTAKTKLASYQSQLGLAKELGDVEGYRKYAALVGESKRSVFDLGQKAEAAGAGLGDAGAAAGTMALGLKAAAVAGAATAAVLVGLVSVTKDLVELSMAESFEKNSWIAQFQALSSGAEGAGAAVNDMIGDLAQRLPQSDKQIVEWTKHIQAMGVTDLTKIRAELVATASAQAIMGDQGAAAYEKIQQRVMLAVESHHGLKLAEKSLTALYKAGVNETEVAKRMGLTTQELGAKLKAGTIDAAKFGEALRGAVTEKGRGPLDVMMTGIDALTKKAHEAFGNLFEDVDTKPLTDALRNVIALGDQGAPSGQALKGGITTGINGIIRALGAGITEAEIFFLTLELRALQAYVYFKPVIGAIDRIGKVMGAASDLAGAGKGAAGGAAGGGAPAPANGNADAMSGVGKAAWTAVSSGFFGGFPEMVGQFTGLLASVADAKALEVARESGRQAGKAVVEGVKEGTETHSPSRAAIRIGMGIGAGLGEGMEGSPAPARAARTISSNALGGLGGGAFGAPANGNAGAGAATGGNTIHITIMAPDGVTDAQELSIVGLSTALERMQIGSGR